MSGGVDSSVVALRLREQGYRVIGLFMKNWEEKDANGVCTSAQDYADVERVCRKLDIPYYAIEFVKEYRDSVFAEFLADYRAGLTPNPDILCNREIKFKVFFEKALELGADFLATGHYCRRSGEAELGSATQGNDHRLLKGIDPGKDQSYFVYTLKKQVLAKTLFPVGDLMKSEVRELARLGGIPTAEKKDSTGICFIGERDFRAFLSQYVAAKPGPFKLLDGTEVGTHMGSAFYTLGQRKGLGLGGQGDRWFVVAKDTKRNVVYVERGERHPALYADWLGAGELSWVANEEPSELAATGRMRAMAKVRYRQPDQVCTVTRAADGGLRVDFDEPQRAITPGQALVLYSGEVCLGGGRILECGPSYFEMGKAIPAGLTRSGGGLAEIANESLTISQ